MTTNPKAKYWHVSDAVAALGDSVTVKRIKAWLAEHYPEENHTDVGANLCMLTVNDPNRRHHLRSRKNFRSDSGDPRDKLFRRNERGEATFEIYDKRIHGIVDIREDAPGVWHAVTISNPVISAARAEAEAAELQAPPINSEHDARVRALRAIAVRQGQPAFRAVLLDAYESRCAITGCQVLPLLDAAHIKPYKGEYTNRADNGLLLRTDLHTLFDLGLVWIEQDFTIEVALELDGSGYDDFRGRRLKLPNDPAKRPNKKHLADHAQTASR